jgi:hypothetical protein
MEDGRALQKKPRPLPPSGNCKAGTVIGVKALAQSICSNYIEKAKSCDISALGL